MEKIPIRLENAITKLYTAFHEGKLNAMDGCCCAVGNLCNNEDYWVPIKYLSESGKEKAKIQSGYSHIELRQIESLFMFGYKVNYKGTVLGRAEWADWRGTKLEKESQFKGLCAVVEYLCELDNIPNVMDYTKLFETENDKPKYALV